jgi:hypothetical protein
MNNNYGERVTKGLTSRLSRQVRKIRESRNKKQAIRNSFHILWQMWGSLELAPRPVR